MTAVYSIRPARPADLARVERTLRDADLPLDWARDHGLHALYLLTTTAGDYFPRFGFTEANRDAAPEAVRRSREFSEACPSTALFMTLPLH